MADSPRPTLCETLRQAGAELRGEGSDLYVRDSETVRAILAERLPEDVAMLTRSLGHTSLWWLVPQAFDQYWQRRRGDRP